jgi:hypothetical protein
LNKWGSSMRTHRIKIRPDGRLPSGGIPFHLMDGLPLARGDLQSRAERCRGAFCLDRDDARAGPSSFDTGPPGWTIRLPVSGGDCRGSTPPKKPVRHRGRSPDKIGTSVAICQSRFEFGLDCPAFRDPVQRDFVPAESGLTMTIQRGWSPPGRNGPVGTGPPNAGNRHPEQSRFLTSEGSAQRGNSQILRPIDLGLRMTRGLEWSPPGRNGPVGTSPPTGQKRARESLRQTYAHPPWWDASDKESRVGFRGSGAPISGSRYPDSVLTTDRSEQLWNCQIHRPDKSGLRKTYASWSKVIANNVHSDGERRISVLKLSEGKKFSRSKYSGTPSFSLIANQTDDLFTINAFS